MRSLSLLLPLLACVALPARAQAPSLNRCTDANGQSVYTDRACEAIGARSRLPAPGTFAAGNTGDRDQLGARCPRRLSQLVDALREAVASHDVNRLSSLYLWGQVSDSGALRILGQLDSIARRPLVDIAPVYPGDDDGMTPVHSDPAMQPRPVALRLEQVLPGSATPARSVVGLHRQHGCFWISL